MNEDDEPEVELSGEREGAPLDATNVPIIVTVSQVREACRGNSSGNCSGWLVKAVGCICVCWHIWQEWGSCMAFATLLLPVLSALHAESPPVALHFTACLPVCCLMVLPRLLPGWQPLRS
jgi:hypothetical protein